MPADRTLAEGLAVELVKLYADLETRLAADIGRRLAQGIKLPDWAQRKHAGVAQLRRAAEQMLADLDADLDGKVEQAIALAYARGGEAAVRELVRLRLTEQDQAILREGLPQAAAIQRMVFALASTLRGTHLRILRWDLDVYRQVVAETVLTGTLVGNESRLRTAQRIWDKLVSRGVTGFVDKAGRNWALTSYVEMATRTGTAQAAVEGHLDRLREQGIDLVIVSDAPQECERCRPWEGKVLSRAGAPGRRTVEVPHATQDRMIAVEIAGSVGEAIARGLMHPNCRHSLSAYLPGVTKVPTNTEDPEGDEARRRLRALERKLRKEKTRAAAAIDPAAGRQHQAKVRTLQAQIREHVDGTPGLLRQRHREQIGAGNIPPPPRPARRKPDQPDPLFNPPRAEPAKPAVEPAPEPAPAPELPDLADWTDEQLEAGIVEHADNPDLFDQLVAELDAREAARAEPAVEPEAEQDDANAEKWARFDELIAQGVDEREAYAEAFDVDPDKVARDDAIKRLRGDGYRGRGFDELARAAYRDALQRDYFAAEAATNGFLLTAVGQRTGLDPRELWRQNEAYARKWASDELKQWWDENGRLTFDQFAAQLLSGANEQRFHTGGDAWLR